MIDVAKIRKLLDDATKGEWHIDRKRRCLCTTRPDGSSVQLVWCDQDMDLIVAAPTVIAELLDFAVEAKKAAEWMDRHFIAECWADPDKETPQGLDPTFYGTLTKEGDEAIKAMMAGYRTLLSGLKVTT